MLPLRGVEPLRFLIVQEQFTQQCQQGWMDKGALGLNCWEGKWLSCAILHLKVTASMFLCGTGRCRLVLVQNFVLHLQCQH